LYQVPVLTMPIALTLRTLTTPSTLVRCSLTSLTKSQVTSE